jgi:dTDP-glucose 4,6-dehydratase
MNDSELESGWTKFKPDPNIKSVLVTGGAGFIASWLIRHLVLTYPYHVVCYDCMGYCSSVSNLKMVQEYPNFTLVKGDITDPDEVNKTFQKFNIDTVIHMAAESHVDHSFGNPYKFTHTNVIGTQVILEASKKFKVNKFVHMSTDEVYGEVDHGQNDLRETSILIPTNPYAASKACGDMLASAYMKSFDMPILVIRCNNIYGPHQFPEKIIPKFVCLVQRGRKCILHGDGSNTRRYLHVSDAVSALDTILHMGEVGKIYNAGSDFELSNLDLAKHVLRACGHNSDDPEVLKLWIEHVRDRPFNDSRYAINSSRLEKLGWQPKKSFEDGLRETIEWYKLYSDIWWKESLNNSLKGHPNTIKPHYPIRADSPAIPS